ncbi:MAG: hypothetical protein ACKVP7_14070 [Hyphomicrobiaceae bacterium]
MTPIDWQLGLLKLWTDTAQTWWKVGTEAANVATKMATTGVPPTHASLPSLANVWTGSGWPAAWPMTGMSGGMSAWPGFGWPGVLGNPMLGNPMLANPWLQMFGMPGVASPLAWMGWPQAASSFGTWPFSALPFGGWPQNLLPTSGWPMAGTAWPWNFGSQSPNWPWFPMTTGLPAPLSAASMWGTFQWPSFASVAGHGSTKTAAERASVASFRTAGGHATAPVITEPIDLARSMVSFWALEPDANRRKSH